MQWVSHLAAQSVNFNRHAVHNIFFLVLIHHKAVIGIRKEINIDQPVVRNIALRLPAYLLHIVIINGNIIFVAHPFVNQEITGYFSDHFEIHPLGIVAVRLRVNDFLGKKGGSGNSQAKKANNVSEIHKILRAY